MLHLQRCHRLSEIRTGLAAAYLTKTILADRTALKMMREDPMSQAFLERRPRLRRIHTLETSERLLGTPAIRDEERRRNRDSVPRRDLVKGGHDGIVSCATDGNGPAIRTTLIYSRNARSRTCMEL